MSKNNDSTGSAPVSANYSTKGQLSALAQIQEVDLKVDLIKQKKNDLPAQLRDLDAQLAKLAKLSGDKQHEITVIEKNRKQVQAALDMNQERTVRANERLEAIKNNDEFQAITKELDQLKKQNSELTTQLTKLAQEIETLSRHLTEFKLKSDEVNGQREKIAGDVNHQVSALDADLNGLLDQRKDYQVSVSPAILNKYDRVRGARQGRGICATITGRCTGCNTMLPPQLSNEVTKAKEIHFCPRCHRILYNPDTIA